MLISDNSRVRKNYFLSLVYPITLRGRWGTTDGQESNKPISTRVYKSIFVHNYCYEIKEVSGGVTKLPKVAKPKFRFGHFRMFRGNSTSLSPTKLNLCANMLSSSMTRLQVQSR